MREGAGVNKRGQPSARRIRWGFSPTLFPPVGPRCSECGIAARSHYHHCTTCPASAQHNLCPPCYALAVAHEAGHHFCCVFFPGVANTHVLPTNWSCCGKEPAKFLCITCAVSLCATCAAAHSGHHLNEYSSAERHAALCDGDSKSHAMVGTRYRCACCYDFDLCEYCWNHGVSEGAQHKLEHSFIMLRYQDMRTSMGFDRFYDTSFYRAAISGVMLAACSESSSSSSDPDLLVGDALDFDNASDIDSSSGDDSAVSHTSTQEEESMSESDV
eukprot:TRINITY_DN1561_c0_g1_i4.p1 TRINITY_DN1561_c0_g1~~TRINITY_DN1561_c0_g1_i4.p1  ORF type:complete len:272 (-),score=36.23 TRINITY_DN1561_c0_g1_i4:1074-1889(-)